MLISFGPPLVLKYERLYAAELQVGNRSQDAYTMYTDCEKQVFVAGSGNHCLYGF